MLFLEARVMSNRNLAAAALQIFSVRPHSSQSPARIVEFLRRGLQGFAAWRRRRREREELYEFLASDHRIAADIGYRHHREADPAGTNGSTGHRSS